MKKRGLILLGLLWFRVMFNYFEARQYSEGEILRVSGKVNKIERNVSEYIIYVGKFKSKFQGYNKFSQNQQVSLFGTVKHSLINDLMGKIELSSAEIDAMSDNYQSETGMPSFFNVLERIREKMVGVFERHLPAKEAALVAGIVLGDKKGISGDFYEQMVNSGTVHIAVASGFNLMILSGSLMSWLFWVVKRSWATVVGIGVAGIYTLMAGAEPPVARALVMVSLLLIGAVLGRRQSATWALLLTALVMLMFDVSLINSASFQLSIMASVGLMWLEPLIMKYFETKESSVIQLFSRLGVTTSVATMLTTMPIIWWHFGRVGLMGIISNVLVLPLVPMIMLLGALMIPLGGVMTIPVYTLVHGVVLLIEWFGV